MGKIVNPTFVSLDGVINHMDRWHFDFVDDESDAFAQQLRDQRRAADGAAALTTCTPASGQVATATTPTGSTP